MTKDDVLQHVVRATIDTCERRRSLSERDLAAELGVDEHHVLEAFRTMAARRWCVIGSDNQVSLACSFLNEMKSFVNPLPNKPKSEPEARKAVASEILRRIQDDLEFTLDDIASVTAVTLGRVRRYIKKWNDEIGSEEFIEDSCGQVHWNGYAADHLEAAVDGFDEDESPGGTPTSVVINATNAQTAIGGSVFGGNQNASFHYGSQSSSDDQRVSATEFRADVSEALALLAKDMDTLGSTVEEALFQFLRIARTLDVDGKTVGDVRDMVEELWLDRAKEKLNLTEFSASKVGKAFLQNGILKVIVGLGTAGLTGGS